MNTNEDIICGIYKIVSPTGRVYIGQSNDICKRWRAYRHLLCGNQKILYRSLVKYGINNHEFVILEVCESDFLNEREMYYIESCKSFNPHTGMNCTAGGGGMKRYKWAASSKDNMSRILKEKYKSGYLNPFQGKRHSDEAKRKVGEKNKGRVPSEELKQKCISWRKDKSKVEAANKKRKTSLIEMWQRIKSSETKYKEILLKRTQRHKATRTNSASSGYKGVYYLKNKKSYKVIISINKNRIEGGSFKDPAVAAKKYNELAIRYLGDMAILNKVA